jgi:hypothetical protein
MAHVGFVELSRTYEFDSAEPNFDSRMFSGRLPIHLPAVFLPFICPVLEDLYLQLSKGCETGATHPRRVHDRVVGYERLPMQH